MGFRRKKVETYAEGLEEVLGVLVDVEHARLGVLGEVEGRDLGDVLVLALALLFLELERDTADGTTLDTLHQVSGVTGDLLAVSALLANNSRIWQRSYLVAQALGGNDGNLIADALVGLEVESQLGVVTLNDDLGGLLDSLGTNATHFGGMCVLAEEEMTEKCSRRNFEKRGRSWRICDGWKVVLPASVNCLALWGRARSALTSSLTVTPLCSSSFNIHCSHL
jgi:hypothetical protein